ncbi:hypothetical protein ACFXKS_30485 [Streptomyces scopuliridis]|uniref:hypothetical protein n=1 Tax=Streptomyces scopuliridis TaxID=452529 RepID=UPI0036C7B09E
MVRTAWVRWTAWTAGVLALVLLAAWVWWRESDTGDRWRFEETMKTYCGGLLAHEKSSLFEGFQPNRSLTYDRVLGSDAQYCQVDRAEVTVALLRAEENRFRDWEKALPHFSGSLMPMPLTGGWRGAADGGSVRVLLDCRGNDDVVAVTVGSYLSMTSSEEETERRTQKNGWLDGDLYWARFATATAVKASAHWGCEAEKGKAVRSLPAVGGGSKSTTSADGTCAGLPFGRDERLDTVWETGTSTDAVYERCEVGAYHYFDARYEFTARFGPYASSARADSRSEILSEPREAAGANARGQWASARCPGDTERALFTGSVPVEAATVWLPGEKGEETFGLPAFREFAERSAKRHGCTDLRLPTGG